MNKIILCTAALMACHIASAAEHLIYQTGWEPDPADPAWLPGNVVPQNGWLNFNSVAGHQVVSNGTPNATIGQPVVAAGGEQFHRFNASLSTVDTFDRLAWVDMTGPWDARPSGMNVLESALDLYVPAAQSTDDSLYGLLFYDGATELFGLFVEPVSGGVYLYDGTSLSGTDFPAFTLGAWFNLSVTADFDTGALTALVNGVEVLSAVNPDLAVSSFSDADLFAQNTPTGPAVRSIFSDNFRVVAKPPPVVLPPARLDITRLGGDGFRVSWPAALADWVLEQASEVPSISWTNTPGPLTTNGPAVSVEFTNAAPFRAFRLRQP
jgi:hypothetical protein